MRIYIATFDSDDGADYNSGNCWIVAKLFEDQEDVKTQCWCEPSMEEK